MRLSKPVNFRPAGAESAGNFAVFTDRNQMGGWLSWKHWTPGDACPNARAPIGGDHMQPGNSVSKSFQRCLGAGRRRSTNLVLGIMFSAERRSIAARFVRRASEGFRGEKLLAHVCDECPEATLRDLTTGAFLAVTRQQDDQAAVLAIYDVAILLRKANNLGM